MEGRVNTYDKAENDLTEGEVREKAFQRLDRLFSKRTRHHYSVFMTAGVAWMSLIFYALLIQQLPSNPMYLCACLILTFLSAMLYWLIAIKLKSYRLGLHCRLSALTESERKALLPGSGTGFERITQHVPRLFRMMFPRSKFQLSPGDQAEVVAKNLDWYLEAPRRLVRLRWVSDLFYFWLLTIWLWPFLIWYQPLYSFNFGFLWLAYILNSPFLTVFRMIGDRHHAIRVEVYREFVWNWYQNHPLEPVDE